MNKRLLGLGLVLSMVVASCSKDENNSTDTNSNNFNVNTNASELKSAVNFNGAGVLGVTSITNLNSRMAGEDAPQVVNIALEQIATVDPPVLDGRAMRANHVDVQGDYAYVAYTKEGNDYLGGIDIIDITDKYNPVVVSRMTSGTSDINALFYKDGTIYFTGATNSPVPSAERAILGKVFTENGEFTSEFTTTNLIGQTGVDIFSFEDNIIAFTGSEGSIGSYSSESLEAIVQQSFPDLRSGAYHNGKLVALSGDAGLLSLNTTDFSQTSAITLSSFIPESKRTVAFYNEMLMVSEGEDGVGIYNLTTGAEVARLPINMLPGAEVEDVEKVTNAVTSTNGFILMANGGAGFGISKLNENNLLMEEGLIEIDGSVNYVQAKGEYIFVASGTGGLKILRVSSITNEEVVETIDDAATASFVDCEAYLPYEDKNGNLTVSSNSTKSISGTTTLKTLNVNGVLNYCGTLNVEKTINIASHAAFNFKGSLAMGQVGKTDNLKLTAGSVTKFQGSMIIYGDIELGSGAVLEFVGDANTVMVYGHVTINSGAVIKGNFQDLSNKFN